MPNILLLMCDELRADVTGFGGNRIVRTPNLDRLAAMSTVFGQAYTPAPVCIPARQCIAAGQLPTTCGCQTFFDDLRPGYLTFPRLLSQHGWETAACGKLHHTGSDQMQGYTRRMGMECEVGQQFIDGLKAATDPFAHKWDQATEVLRATVGKSYHVLQDEVAAVCAEHYIQQFFSDPYYDRETPDRPLLLTVSFNQPHYPYVADAQLLKYYLPRVEPYLDQPAFDLPFLNRFKVALPEEKLRRATAAYYAMVETADGYVGRVLEAFRKAGQDLRDWIVLFTSDHGEMLGQHGVWEKQKFFEGSIRVPLFIHMPGCPDGRRCDKNVSLCDLYATIISACGLELPTGLDSRDLSPLIRGDDANWNDQAVSMYGGENIMIKKGHLKYQYYKNGDAELLFDLLADPTENISFHQDTAYANALREFRVEAGAYGFAKGKDGV